MTHLRTYRSKATAPTAPRRLVRSVGPLGASIFVLGGLSACEVGPDYSAPQPALSAFHNEGAVAARGAHLPAPVLDTWWTGFRDPELTRIVERALDQNLDLAASIARVD